MGARRRRGAKKSVFSCICVLLVAMTCSVQTIASESRVELSYDRVKFIASVLAAHSRSDLARHVHVAMYSCGIRVALGILSK